MQEVTLETTSAAIHDCPSCKQALLEAEENNETGLSFLLALVPLLTLTLFSQVGIL